MDLGERRKDSALLVKELAAFLFFGGMAAAVNLLVGWQLYGRGLFPALPYWCATGLAAFSGLLVNFGLNYAFNFKFRGRSAWQQFVTFSIVASLGVALTSGLSFGLLSLLNAWIGPAIHLGRFHLESAFAAHFTAVGLTVLYSFPAHKCMSFNVGIRAQVQQVYAQVSERA